MARTPSAAPEMVDHPAHYNAGEIECIDGIEAALGRELQEVLERPS